MGAHKYNPVAIAAKNGEMPPKTKKRSKQEKRIIENTVRKIVEVAPSNLAGPHVDEFERSFKNEYQRICEVLREEGQEFRDPLLEEGEELSYGALGYYRADLFYCYWR